MKAGVAARMPEKALTEVGASLTLRILMTQMDSIGRIGEKSTNDTNNLTMPCLHNSEEILVQCEISGIYSSSVFIPYFQFTRLGGLCITVKLIGSVLFCL
ncbi:hypothetical protein F2P56_031747, partial [Juglans regia]